MAGGEAGVAGAGAVVSGGKAGVVGGGAGVAGAGLGCHGVGGSGAAGCGWVQTERPCGSQVGQRVTGIWRNEGWGKGDTGALVRPLRMKTET